MCGIAAIGMSYIYMLALILTRPEICIQLKCVQNELNSKPIKILNYKTPMEI